MTDNGTVLVTGTSSGIGLATAIALAGAGWTVAATVRDPDRAERLRDAASAAGVRVHVHRLDVTDQDSVRACVDGVLAEHGSLQALVNNAGAAHVGTVEVDDMDAFRASMEVNFFGTVAMTRAAMPHLRASRGRIVLVSSVGGVVGQPFNEAYCASKFAVEGFGEALAPVAARVGVQVTLVEPGAVASEFVANAGIDAPAMVAAAGPYAEPLDAYLRLTGTMFQGAQSAQDVAGVIADVLAADEPPLRIQTSDSSRAFAATKLADLDGSAVRALTSGWFG